MADPAAALAWLQLHDNAFPAGRFVHSYGVESWLQAHPAASDSEICRLAESFVRHSVATLDAVVVAHAWAVEELSALTALDALTTSYKLTANARAASHGCGRQLALVAQHVGVRAPFLGAVTGGRADGNLAVVEAVVQRELGIGRLDAALGSIRSGYAGVLSAAVRLGRLGPIRAQRAMLDARRHMVEMARLALATPLDDMHSTTPELEIWAMRHETASGRMFTT